MRVDRGGRAGFAGLTITHPIKQQVIELLGHLFDIVSMPVEAALLRAARAAGLWTLDGAAMCVCPAAAAFELLTGRTPDTARMLAASTGCRPRGARIVPRDPPTPWSTT
ncbi:hypothetical protein [Actinoplanes sp. NPDC049599]|uniref:hypothetical protein n=1 Tax=Actinoplanes sp. NPDC049599 TaxID=3363903 RepID=UPI0037AB2371